MRLWFSIVAGALAILAASGLQAQDFRYEGFDGTWVGSLHVVDAAAIDSPIAEGKAGQALDFAIVVAGDTAKVYSRPRGKWDEVMPGFQIGSHSTNAIVFATGSGKYSDGGGWVESWTFTLTHRDRDSLYAAVWRVVNNYSKPPDQKGARVAVALFGEFRKTADLPK